MRELMINDEFLAWLEPGVHADLIGGEVLRHAPVRLRHADLPNNLDDLVRASMKEGGVGKL